LQDRMQRNESVIFISMEHGEATGFTQLYPIFSSVSLERAWLLNDLFVRPDARKSGAGSLLLERAKDWGRETGARWLLLSTGCENFTAQSLYEKNGWKKVSDIYYEFVL
jgi:GNAT superfamily N-acetyltransferase